MATTRTTNNPTNSNANNRKPRRYWLMVNEYRSSTSNGFANTWTAKLCRDLAHRSRVLREGLPVSDAEEIGPDGRRRALRSTMGLRVPTQAERREAERDYLDEVGYDSFLD